MNDRELIERITNMIDESAPAVSVEQVVAHSHAGAVEGRRQTNPRLVIAFSAAVLILITAVVVVGVATRSSNSNIIPTGLGQGVSGHLSPLPNASLTPAGWAPLEFGNVQVSVPGTWSELVGGACAGHSTLMAIQIRDPGCRAAYVTVQSASKKTIPHAQSLIVNGIPVVEGHSGSGGDTIYMERALGVDIRAKGSVAQQALGTITYSPLSLLLDSDVHGIPTEWRAVDYHGVAFDIPGSWSIAGTGPVASCALYEDTVVLDSVHASASGACTGTDPFGQKNSISRMAGLSAVSVASTPMIPGLSQLIIKFSQCVSRNGLKVCIASPAQQQFATAVGVGSQAVSAFVYLPGHPTPVTVEIGLPEPGLTALEILDSFKPADTSASTQPSKTLSPSTSTNRQSPPTTRASTSTTIPQL
jgi:hypothetical protein